VAVELHDDIKKDGVMKLYVLGERSGDPNDWRQYGSRVFVLARSREEALSLHSEFSTHVAEVPTTEPCILCHDDYVGCD
jgi:hypothetical protein